MRDIYLICPPTIGGCGTRNFPPYNPATTPQGPGNLSEAVAQIMCDTIKNANGAYVDPNPATHEGTTPVYREGPRLCDGCTQIEFVDLVTRAPRGPRGPRGGRGSDPTSRRRSTVESRQKDRDRKRVSRQAERDKRAAQEGRTHEGETVIHGGGQGTQQTGNHSINGTVPASRSYRGNLGTTAQSGRTQAAFASTTQGSVNKHAAEKGTARKEAAKQEAVRREPAKREAAQKNSKATAPKAAAAKRRTGSSLSKAFSGLSLGTQR